MRKIAILGNSIGLIPLLNQLRASNTDDKISVYSVDGQYPYNCENVAALLTSAKNESKLLSEKKEYYKENDIYVEIERRVTRINLNRKKIHFNDKTQEDFNVLIICDTPELKFIDIKGTNKEGVYSLSRFDHIKRIFQNIPLVDTISIQADSIRYFKLAVSITENEREVFYITDHNGVFGLAKESRGFEILSEACFGLGLMIYTGTSIHELLGDHDIKAVRLKSGKVLSSQIVIFEKTRADTRVFSDHLAVNDHRLCIDSNCQTNIEGVYAFDYLSVEQDQQKARLNDAQIIDQTYKIAAHLSSTEKKVNTGIMIDELKIAEVSLVVISKQAEPEEGCEEVVSQSNINSYEKYLVKGNKIIQAVLINPVTDIGEVYKAIEGNLDITQVVDIKQLEQDCDNVNDENQEVIQLEGPVTQEIEKTANSDV